MLRRLYHEQPASFAFTPGNLDWARGQIAKYPEGRQASAVIPLLWRAQEQEGWITRPAIEEIARMLDMATIRVLEVATFYFMFHLAPVGRIAHVQVCGTTSCMLSGAEDLIAVCRDRIAPGPFEISADGDFSWEEVECLGACANGPMAQIGKDYYEDLTAESFAGILEAFGRGEVPRPGPQDGRFSSEPKGGATSLGRGSPTVAANASVTLALERRDTIGRVTGDAPRPVPAEEGVPVRRPAARAVSDRGPEVTPQQPAGLSAPRDRGHDDLKRIKGIGPKLEQLLFRLGYYHYDQLAGWTPEEVAWVDENLEGFRGRVTREGWVEQARVLAEEGETAFSNRADRNRNDGK